MKTAAYILSFIFTCIIFAACKVNDGPKITHSAQEPIQIRNHNLELVRTIVSSTEIVRIVEIMNGAQATDKSESAMSAPFTNTIDVGKVRWLYDSDTGVFRLLSKSQQQIYAIRPQAKVEFNMLLNRN